jgi:hypothetical protein
MQCHPVNATAQNCCANISFNFGIALTLYRAKSEYNGEMTHQSFYAAQPAVISMSYAMPSQSLRNLKTLVFTEASFSLLLLLSVITNSTAKGLTDWSSTQLWTNTENNMKILFTHSPRYPWVNTPTLVAFTVDNLRTGNHLKNLLATGVIINNSSGQQKIFKFNHLYAPNGVFSVKYFFPLPGMYQIIIRIDSNNPPSIALASFSIFVTPFQLIP